MSNPSDDQAAAFKEEQDKIRLKRLAKLSSPAASSSSSPSPAQATPPPPPPVKRPSAPVTHAPPTVTTPVVRPSPKIRGAEKLDLTAWEAQTVGRVFNVTLNRAEAEREDWNVVWLKEVMLEIEQEEPTGPRPPRLSVAIADRILIARLSLDPNAMTDDAEMIVVLGHLPEGQTVFEYLTGCWKRLNSARVALGKKNYSKDDQNAANAKLDELRHLIVSYAGLNLQDPEMMFPQPSNKPIGVPELVAPLLTLSSSPLNAPETTLSPSDIEAFVGDIARRFEGDGLEDILGPVVDAVIGTLKEGEYGLINLMGDEWRKVAAALEALVALKPVAAMLPKLETWAPARATPPIWELVSLLGPLIRLSPFPREWPAIAKAYFANPPTLTRDGVDGSNATLRTTLTTLQGTLFHILNAVIRSGGSGKDGTLAMFSQALNLNWRRAGLHVDPSTVASDGFMINMQAVLLRFAEPFIDVNYSKIDRIDPLYLAKSKLVNASEETRVLASSEEAKEIYGSAVIPNEPAPGFISDIFFLLSAYHHLGFIRAIAFHEDSNRSADEIQRNLDRYQRDTRWQGTPMQAQVQGMVDKLKSDLAEEQSQIFAQQVQLLDPDLIARSIAFSSLVMTWILRLVDPTKQYPKTQIRLPLPQEVPPTFKVLPEYFIEDVADLYSFILRMCPQHLQWAGKQELIVFVLTFLSSTWYIRNPYLKSKLVAVMAYGSGAPPRTGPLTDLLNTHPLALQQLMPALMAYYVDCESTGTHTQFYDKFEIRRNITTIFRAIWHNPTHRAALKRESENLDNFVRFINLLRNDVTFLLDESLGKLGTISAIQQEMDDQATWNAQPARRRQEREGQLRSLEGQASSYFSLGRSTVNLLKDFSAETKKPFMTPEIVDRLASMLDDNLGKMVGPKAQELKVKDPERLRFHPRELLSDLLTVYLNLSSEPEFVQATAKDVGYYRKELFERAVGICKKRALKTDDEIERLRLFVIKVEETRALQEGDEEELGDIPDEFTDPIMATIMRDPVILPTSRTIIDRSTIKAHLLSDQTDPFNRMKLSIDDVIPDTELKARIDEWLISRRTQRPALTVPEGDLVDMDVDVDL